jgi:hypothetical protein
MAEERRSHSTGGDGDHREQEQRANSTPPPPHNGCEDTPRDLRSRTLVDHFEPRVPNSGSFDL